MILGHPALRKLAILKLRGLFRRQAQRMRSASGLFFVLLGLLLMGLWIASIAIAPQVPSASRWDGPLLRSTVQVGILVLAFFGFASAVQVRGVYFPRQEIERLFSIPVSRSDLVRHRLQIDVGRTLLGAVVLGLLVCRRMPVPVFGFLGAFLAVLFLSVLRQTASLVLGDARSRIGRLFASRRMLGIRILMAVAAWLAVMLLFFGEGLFDDLRGLIRGRNLRELAEGALLHPIGQWILLPFRPWAQAMTAESLGPFLGWTALCVFLWAAAIELTARLPIDFRELSLSTSEEIAKRLRTIGRGGPFDGGRISDAAAGRRVPWLFGRGPFGAVAWIKTGAILRKARGTLLLSLAVVGLVTVLLSTVVGELGDADSPTAALLGPIMIAIVGMVYLAGGLRFDFRADLDRMEAIKSWPLGPTRLFFATLLPETALISAVIALAIVVRALVLGLMHPGVLAVVAVLPFATLAWLAVDNAVFLLAPVRFVPGQEGTLHHTGRALVLLFLRGLIFLAGLIVVALPVAALVFLAGRLFELSPPFFYALGAIVALCMLTLVDAALLWLGGRMLRRFDLARDR